jgi:acetoin:2,6-dichlorophenolindophenol oxidoreductase subunit beta
MRTISYLQAINEALREEMARDEKVFLIGESIQSHVFFLTQGLMEEFGPERVMDTTIAETALAGAGIGSAMAGYRPVCDFVFADFIFVAADEILLKAAKWRAIHGGKVEIPVVFMAAMGGGMRLGAEHSQSPHAYIMHTPGLKLALPATPYDAKGLMKTAIRDNNPVVFLYHKLLMGSVEEVPEEEYTIPFGQADIKRAGTDVTVVATSMMVSHSLDVAARLEGRISVEVIDPRTLEPLDMDTIIESVQRTGRVVVVDEGAKRCGAAAEIAAQITEIAFDFLAAPVQRVAAANLPIPGGIAEEHVLPQPKDILAAIETVVR